MMGWEKLPNSSFNFLIVHIYVEYAFIFCEIAILWAFDLRLILDKNIIINIILPPMLWESLEAKRNMINLSLKIQR